MKRMLWVLLLIAAAASARAAEDGLRIDVVAGGQAVDTDSQRDAWYYKYALNPDGAVIPLLKIQRLKADDPLRFTLKGKWILRDDPSYRGTLDRPGRGRLSLFYDQTPHWYYRSSLVLWNQDNGSLTLDESVRATLEGAAFGPAPTTDVPPLMTRILGSTAHRSDLTARRDTWGLSGDVSLTPRWRLAADFGHQKRGGDKLISAGTYVRSAPNDSTFDRETFDVRGTDLVEPVDYRTWQGAASTDYRGGFGFIQVGIDVSLFRNELDALRWDNPFEADPGVRTIDGQSQASRGRYATGQLALAPDNDYWRGHLSGLLKLGPRARISATAALSRMTQDQEFLPFTQNDSIFFPGPDGTLGTVDDVPGTDPSLLPGKSLNGEISTTRVDFRFSGRPADRVTVEATGRYYQYDDKTPRLDLPGYAAFGESAFRRGIGQTEGGQSVLFNDPSSYDQTRFGVSAGWTIRASHLLTAGLERVTTDYDGRQVDKTNENIASARLRGSSGRVDWSAFYELGRRDHEGDYEVGLEVSRLRMFDVWDRDRDRFGAHLDAELSPGFLVGLSGSRVKDEYPGAVEGAPYGYGLQESDRNEVSLSLNYSPAKNRWELAGAVGYDDSEWKSLAVTKTAWDASSTYDPVNRWFRVQDDKTVWGSAEIKADLVPGRWTGKLGYDATLFTGDVLTTNPEVTARTINSAYAQVWSQLKTTWHEVRLSLDHWFMPGFGLGLRYAFSPFRIDDPAWDSLQPYMQGVLKELRGSPTDIQNVNAARYLFLDSRYDDTNTHVIRLVVTAKLK